MVKTGSSEVIGSWKTIAATRPRIADIARLPALSTSSPASDSVLAVILAGGSRRSRSSAAQVTDLPEPDSPTMPRLSPRVEVEAHAAHGLHDAVVLAEADVQVLYLDQPHRAGVPLIPRRRRASLPEAPAHFGYCLVMWV